MAHQFIQLEKTFKAFQNSRSSHEQEIIYRYSKPHTT